METYQDWGTFELLKLVIFPGLLRLIVLKLLIREILSLIIVECRVGLEMV